MNTVTFEIFNDPKKVYNSFEHLGLYLSKKTIGAATPKLLKVDISGGNGTLDYTEYFGAVNYNDRPLSFEFSAIGNHREFLQQYSLIQNCLNGQKVKVTLSDDPDFYYIGRLTVNDWKTEKNIGKLVLDVTAQPYKLKHALTVIYRTISKETVINCRNLKKTTTPKISFTSTGAKGYVMFGGKKSDEFSSTLENFTAIFGEGDNLVKVTPSSGATLPIGVMIEYQEGCL